MIDNKSVLVVVTARAGSSMKGKNFRSFCGQPLFCWSIDAALESYKYIDMIFVSSNCEDVKNIFYNKGYQNRSAVHFVSRPDKISTAVSKNEDALIHSVEVYKEMVGFDPDIVVNLQPTSPIRDNNLLDCCLRAMADSQSDSLLTVSKDTPFVWKRSGCECEPLYDILNRPMRQEIAEDDFFLHDNGNIYAIETEILKERNCRIGYNPYLFETNKFQSLQIDDEDDFILMEKVAEIIGGCL